MMQPRILMMAAAFAEYISGGQISGLTGAPVVALPRFLSWA